MTSNDEARQTQADFSPAELNQLTETLRQQALRIPGAARSSSEAEAVERRRIAATQRTPKGKPGI